MQLIKFLFGIILVQLVTVVLVILLPNELDTTGLLRLAIPLFFMALMVAFWFASLSAHHRKDEVEKVKSSFAQEREKLKVNAERAKTRVVKQAQKDIAKEARTTHAKANFKVGAAFAGVLGVGALFVFAQMMTVGLLTIAAAGGAMGGYYWRGKRIENQFLDNKNSNIKVLESKPSRF
ncbi:hypothetical protein KKC13_02680 [bacterium]|nr:hypothetical protein [bacterium]MBU1957149.1 hypothetical protein [bacterium]